jgi:hypothetical protein
LTSFLGYLLPAFTPLAAQRVREGILVYREALAALCRNAAPFRFIAVCHTRCTKCTWLQGGHKRSMMQTKYPGTGKANNQSSLRQDG